MKMRLGIGLGLLCTAMAFAAPDAAQSEADALWQEIEELRGQAVPAPQRVDDRTVFTRDYFEELERRGIMLGDVLLQFVETHPDDPRQWDAIVALTKVYRPVFENIGADVGTEGWNAVTQNTGAQSEWRARVLPHVQRLLLATDVAPTLRLEAYSYWVAAALPLNTGGIPTAGQLAQFRQRLDEMRAQFPNERAVYAREWQYLNRLREVEPSAVMNHLDALISEGGGQLAAWARAERNTELLREHPLELEFTAIDGRVVDFARLRGKVVLLDFWATWCSPCIAELPNVKAVYEKYHDRGFEVIAVSLDKRGDLEKLKKFVNEWKLPWPQHFVLNEAGRNVLAEKYGVLGIPAMFLFDRNGLLATTNARGEKLEAEVKRLLGL